jgi:NAD(P)-dependent dehydrogenase (short-subunit alcohol dehydrogenase family)
MGTNHLSHFSLTLRLLPLLRASAATSPIGARIVNVSSLLHIFARLSPTDMQLQKNSYNAIRAYGNSKCAQVMFTRMLRRFLGSEAVYAFALHPGEVLTNISKTSLPTWAYRLQQLIMPLFLFTTQEGAPRHHCQHPQRSLLVSLIQCALHALHL